MSNVQHGGDVATMRAASPLTPPLRNRRKAVRVRKGDRSHGAHASGVDMSTGVKGRSSAIARVTRRPALLKVTRLRDCFVKWNLSSYPAQTEARALVSIGLEKTLRATLNWVKHKQRDQLIIKHVTDMVKQVVKEAAVDLVCILPCLTHCTS